MKVAGTLALEEIFVAGHRHVERLNNLEAMFDGVVSQPRIVEEQLLMLPLVLRKETRH